MRWRRRESVARVHLGMGKTTAKKPFGKKAPFGTTKGAFGKEGKGSKGGKGASLSLRWCVRGRANPSPPLRATRPVRETRTR